MPFDTPESKPATLHLVAPVSPEATASLWSRLYFTWVKPTLKAGMKQPLAVETLLPLAPTEMAKRCDDDFAQMFATQREKRRPILISMMRLHWPTLARVFAISMVGLTASVSSPLLLRALLKNLSAFSGIHSQGLQLAALLFLAALITSMAQHHMFHTLLKLMVRVRIALVSAIYRKSLRLTIASRQSTPAGQIINLMGTDAQKFVNALNVIFSVWMHPMQFAIILGILYWILGPAALGGAALMFMCLYLSTHVAKRHIGARQRLLRHTDARVGLMNEILMSIRVIKFYAWEASFKREVAAIRDQEVVELTKLAHLSAVGTLLFLSTPIVIAVVTFATFVLAGHDLNAADVFSSMALFTVLRQAMVMLPDVVASCIEANVSIKRVEDFLALPELAPRVPTSFEPGRIVADNASFDWTKGQTACRNLNFDIAPGQLVCIVGTVGSGKSAILSALLGDLELAEGNLQIAGRVAYVPQQAWILNDTIRNNILYGQPFDPARYKECIAAAGLTYDLMTFPTGDETEIGERGVNLSGGQRQRISLARAVYNDANVFLLDDPLSALDNTVGAHVYERCLIEALHAKTRILVTHRLEYADEADLVFVVENGEIVESGSPTQLRHQSGRFQALLKEYQGEQRHDASDTHQSPQISEEQEKLTDAVVPDVEVEQDPKPDLAAKAKVVGSRLMADEERNTGVVGVGVYKQYLAAFAPGIMLVVLLLSFLAKESLTVGTDSWLAYWSTAKDFVLPRFLIGFFTLGMLACLSTYGRSLLISLRGLTAGTAFHTRLLDRVLRAPMGFFESTPVGRVLNRFSRDMEAIDLQIPRSLHEALGCIFIITSTLAVVIAVTPWASVAVVPIALLYYFIQRLFRPASREGQRLDSITRSPLFAQFSESLAGVPVIRAYGVEQRFENELRQNLETNSRAFYTIVSANRWLGTRIETLGAAIVGSAALFAVLTGSAAGVGFAGLSITYALAITGAMNWAVRMFSQLESNLNSVERLEHYSQLPSERWDGATPPENWPAEGHVVFSNYEMRYRPTLKPVIKDFSCEILPGEKIGVVGRTGAGKSSLLLGIFRILEASSGRILIDGLDISQLDLEALRSSLAIIPQEPVLFRGTVRKNLDPFGRSTDHELWDALRRSCLFEVVNRLPEQLDALVHESGNNFSVGQRQLLCLARAILRRSRLLLLDEATANVDVTTDALIQKTIRREFTSCTIITIAHRLGTIMDSDRIMVLDEGRLVEFDAPRTLLGRRSGAFKRLLSEEKGVVLG